MSNGAPQDDGSSMCVGDVDVYIVVSGFTPSRSAVISAITLNEDPGWRWPCAARLNCDLLYWPEEAIARMCPLAGSIVTIADDGPMSPIVFAIEVRASACFLRSIVVWTFRPDSATLGPYSLISSSLT